MQRGEEEIDTDTEWDEFEESEVGSNMSVVESRTNSIIDEYHQCQGVHEGAAGGQEDQHR